MKTALLIAYHYPPYSGSSGLQRTLKFTKYLPEFGWMPVVLTADPRAYPKTSTDLMHEVPDGVVVKRAFALDSSRHLGFRGRYFRITALPDRWVSWWAGAVIAGRQLIKEYRPAVVFSTYPIATAHLIGATLARHGQLPFVADFRDAMVVDDFPEDAQVRRVFERIERRIVRLADAVIFTTPRSRQLYIERYPAKPESAMYCIRNGYDEPDFNFIGPSPPRRMHGNRIRLLHSGLLKLSERDPRPFLRAIAELLRGGELARDSIEVVFRAPGDEDEHRRIIRQHGLQDVVHVKPPVGYRQAIEEMAAADVLLIFQDALCNHLVPAKLYEYIRVGRPVLALTDPGGETAELVTESGAGVVLDLQSTDDIRAALPGFLRRVAMGQIPTTDLVQVQRYSRRSQTGELADIFAKVCGE